MRPGDQAGLLTLTTTVTYVQTITADHAALRQAINGLKAKDDTAIARCPGPGEPDPAELSGAESHHRFDGRDGQPKQETSDQVIQTIGTSGLSISTIGLAPEWRRPLFWPRRIQPSVPGSKSRRCVQPCQHIRRIYPICSSCMAGVTK